MTPTESEDMARLIADCVTPNRTCIVIEHKMELIVHVCTRVCVLNAGRLIADGDPGQVFALPEVIEAYSRPGRGPMLEVHDLHVDYGKISAVRGLSLSVDVGEIVADRRCERCREEFDPECVGRNHSTDPGLDSL